MKCFFASLSFFFNINTIHEHFPFCSKKKKKNITTTIVSIWQEISYKKNIWHFSIQLLGHNGALEMTLLSQIRWPNIWFQIFPIIRAHRVLKRFSEMHCWGLSYLRQERNSCSKFAAWMILSMLWVLYFPSLVQLLESEKFIEKLESYILQQTLPSSQR